MNRFQTAIAGLVLAGCLLAYSVQAVLSVEGGKPISADEIPKVVYVCRDSNDAFLMRASPIPARHPRTGKLTLMPGLYSEALDKWLPAPPPEVLQLHPEMVLCPKSRTPMTQEGPLENVESIED